MPHIYMVITTHYAHYFQYFVNLKQIGCLGVATRGHSCAGCCGIRGRAGWPDRMINRQSCPPDLSYKTLTIWPHTYNRLQTRDFFILLFRFESTVKKIIMDTVPLVAGQILCIAYYTSGLVLVSIVLNVIKQLVFYNRKEPPVVFYWVPFIGSTVAYGMDPYQFFFASRAKVCSLEALDTSKVKDDAY